MSDFDRNIATARTGYRTDQVAINAGLRAYMIRVYNYMTAGVTLTGLVVWFTFSAAVTQTNAGLVLTPFGQTIFHGPLMWLFILAPLGLVMFMSFGINRLSASTALTLFFVYAGVLGISLASIFLVYTGASITCVFFISAATFGAMSLYGYTTQRDLTAVGSFMFMGLIGIIIASLSLALLADALDNDERALRLHEDFNRRVVTLLPKRWTMTRRRILAYLDTIENQHFIRDGVTGKGQT